MIRIGDKILGMKPAVCGVITAVSGKQDYKKICRRADLIELRADLWKINDPQKVIKEIKRIKKNLNKPVILTARAKSETPPNAASTEWTSKQKMHIFAEAVEYIEAVDIELRNASYLKDAIQLMHLRHKKVILSYHNFKKMISPIKFKEKIVSCKLNKGDILKVAVTPGKLNEINNLYALTSEYAKKHALIVIGMGEKAKSTRYGLLEHGSLFTYAGTGTKSAPGQITLTEFHNYFKQWG